jgi:hypothetical protein
VYIGLVNPSLPAMPAPTATETVERPPKGLARGVWEAPPAFFYLVGGAALFAAVVYVLARRGFFKRLIARFFPAFKRSP